MERYDSIGNAQMKEFSMLDKRGGKWVGWYDYYVSEML